MSLVDWTGGAVEMNQWKKDMIVFLINYNLEQ